MPDEARRAAKTVYIQDKDLKRWGYTTNCSRCDRMLVNPTTQGSTHTSACRARVEKAMRDENDPRWHAAEVRITIRLADIAAAEAAADAEAAPAAAPPAAPIDEPAASVETPASPAESPSTLVLNSGTPFVAVLLEEEPRTVPAIDWLPIDVADGARMDLYNTELEDWPVGPE